MLKNWVVQNFKSINERTSLELAPLTVFAGANNSGKSTVIQSILLTAQTIQSQVHSRSVVLNGHIVRLGTFSDIVSNLSDSPNISLGFEIVPVSPKGTPFSFQRRPFVRYYPGEIEALKSIRCEFSFSAAGKAEERDMLQLQPRLESSDLKVQVTQEEKTIDEQITVKRSAKDISERQHEYDLSSSDKKTDYSGLEYEVINQPKIIRSLRRFMGILATGKIVGASLMHFLPIRFAVVYDTVENEVSQIMDALVNPDRAPYYETQVDISLSNKEFESLVLKISEETIDAVIEPALSKFQLERVKKEFSALKEEFTIKNILKFSRTHPQVRREFYSRIDDKKQELKKLLKSDRQAIYQMAYAPVSGFSDDAVDFIQNFFASQVKYLGPLRDEPKPVYPLAGNIDPKDIGFKGENTAAVLEVHRNLMINYVPCDFFISNGTSLQTRRSTLRRAVLDWLNYMGVAQNLETLDKGKLGHELKIATADTSNLHDLTHVGVGVSQVLPILVQSLLSDTGSTLVFEQPELHLHPRVQTRLADFFVSMSMLGKQCIVETHSEYLINRLRYRAAITEGDDISQKVILYFVEKEKGHSKYRPIRINKYGVIEDWPLGFFDESEENAAETLKAGMQKRQKEQDARKKP
jgi:predicted ATPase